MQANVNPVLRPRQTPTTSTISQQRAALGQQANPGWQMKKFATPGQGHSAAAYAQAMPQMAQLRTQRQAVGPQQQIADALLRGQDSLKMGQETVGHAGILGNLDAQRIAFQRQQLSTIGQLLGGLLG